MFRLAILASLSGLLLAPSCTRAPDAPDEFREQWQFLQAHGFKPIATLPNGYSLEDAVLGDVARDLGFKLTALVWVMQMPPEQFREVTAHGMRFTVETAGPTPIDDPRQDGRLASVSERAATNQAEPSGKMLRPVATTQ